MNNKSNYRPEIDGLRAVAVVPVILFHAGIDLFRGGYVGVDVFFVISGYLITCLLIDEIDRGDFSIGRFYQRRARRILPALFVVIICCLPFSWIWMSPLQLKEFGLSIVSVILFISNILFWSDKAYFAAEAGLKPLLHTWSLSVEEQYYLVFPLFLAVFWRFGRNKVFWLIAIIALASFITSEWAWRHTPTANFFLAPTRAWEIFAGSICAFLTTQRTPSANNYYSAAGLALIVFSILCYDETIPIPSVYALAPVLGTALILMYGRTGTWVANLLSTPIFLPIGLISYSAYLWHQPIFSFARIRSAGEPAEWLMISLSGLSLVLGYFSWSYIEKPFRFGQIPLSKPRPALFSAVSVAVFCAAVGFILYQKGGFPERLPKAQRDIASFSEYPADKLFRAGTCFLLPDQNSSEFGSDCFSHNAGLVIGDSHAAAFATGLNEIYDVGQLTASSCPPVFDYERSSRPYCRAINEHILNVIKIDQPKIIILHANWSYYADESFFRSLQATIVKLRSQTGAKIFVLGGVPKYSAALPEIILRSRLELVAEARTKTDLTRILDVDRRISRISDNAGAVFISATDILCNQAGCLSIIGMDEKFFPTAFDYGHLTVPGSVYVAKALAAKGLFAPLEARH